MNKTIRVLYLIDGLGGGGKERQLLEIIKHLSLNPKCIIGVITFNKDQHYSLSIRDYISYFVELSKRPRFEPLFKIWKHIKEFKPDIVHTWDSISSFYSYLPCKILKLKSVDGSIRDAGTEKGWEYFFRRFFLKRANCVISNSFAGLKHYNVPGKVIYNAIDFRRFKTNLENDEYNLIMVANFTDFKDHKTFFTAAIKLLKNNIIDYVYLIGDGPHKQKYLDRIKQEHQNISTKFHFLGQIYNVEDYLSKCKIGVICSTKEYGEGISNSILEYMAAGLVPIATNIGGTTEIIYNGKNGYLINENDSDKIVEISITIRNNKELFENISSAAQATITDKFSSVTNIDKLMNIYSELCIQK